MKVRLDFSDGQYRLIQVKNPSEWPEDIQKGFIEIDPDVWAAYLKFKEQATIWHDFMQEVDNEIYFMSG